MALHYKERLNRQTRITSALLIFTGLQAARKCSSEGHALLIHLKSLCILKPYSDSTGH